MRLPFLTPRAERISADGAVQVVHQGGALGRLRPNVWLLARDLCTFQLFEAGLISKSKRRQAAMLFARTASPYIASGVAVVKVDEDYGVWWWDEARVSKLLPPGSSATGALIRPETLAQPKGEGWRIVRLTSGYEAQFWRAGGLVASNWRRQPFDVASWQAFARLARHGVEAPASPPQPQALAIADNAEAFSWSQHKASPRGALAVGVGALAFLAVFASLFSVGQGLKLAAERAKVERQTSQIAAETPRSPGSQALDADRRRLTAFAEIERRTNPLTASGAALSIVAPYDVSVISVEANLETITLRLPYSSLKSIDALVEEFETSRYFSNVQPRTDAAGEALVIEMEVEPSAPPLEQLG